MPPFIIRQASELDVRAMAQLRQQSGWKEGSSAEGMRLYLAGQHHPQHAKAARAAFLAEDTKDLAEHEQGLAGFIAGHLTTRFGCDGELQCLLVAPSARGGPAATLLWTRLRDWFLEQRARRICVNVADENLPARRFYARVGASELSAGWMVWPDIQGPAT